MNNSLKITVAADIRTAYGEKAGKGFYTYNLIKALIKLNPQINYLLYTQNIIPEFENIPNVSQILINSSGFLWHLKTARHAAQNGVDYFIAPSSYIIPSIISSKVKTITTIHDLVALLFPGTHNKKAVFLEKLLLKRVLKRSHKIIPVSQHTKKDLIENFNTLKSKIEPIPCAAADDYHILSSERTEDFKIKNNLKSPFFLAVGTIIPRKNYQNLVKAFEFFHDKHPDYKLIIVGKPGWDSEEIMDQIKNSHASKSIIFWGYASNEDLVCLYNIATALVFPSFYEGFGIPPLESMLCGCPVISSQTSSLPEVIGEAALFIDPNSPKSIFGAMEKTLEPAVRNLLIKRGLEQAQKFSWAHSAAKLNRLLK